MNKQKPPSPLLPKKFIFNRDDSILDLRTKESKNKNPPALNSPQRIKSNPSFSLQRISTRSVEIAKNSLFVPRTEKKEGFRLPMIGTKAVTNPEEGETNRVYYQSSVYRCLKRHETTYLMNLFRQHFYQCAEVIRMSKSFKLPKPKRQIKLPKINKSFKTIFLDLDETLVHCDENATNCTVRLNFPLQNGASLNAGVRIRPYCNEFLKEVSSFAEIIIFTASSSSYADVILDHLDPEHKLISYRLYRQHCTLEKGFYLKDLRIVDRKKQHSVLVDNSPYCHILQPENAIPVLPFFSCAKDKELLHLIPFLKNLVNLQDLRVGLANSFFYDKYISELGDPRKIFLQHYRSQE